MFFCSSSKVPYIFAFELAFALTLKYYGIIPNAVCGHSVGEVAAACFCGALRIDDAAKVIVARSRCQSMTSTLGGMAAVKLDANDSIHSKQVEIRKMLTKILEAKGVEL